MSYEGRTQVICQNGHFHETDCRDDRWPCPVCDAKEAWLNGVDDTNGDADGIITSDDLKQFQVSPDIKEKRGGVWIIQPATYRSPSEEETLALRSYYDWVSGTRKKVHK